MCMLNRNCNHIQTNRLQVSDCWSLMILSCNGFPLRRQWPTRQLRLQLTQKPYAVRWHMHSASLQKFFTNKTHKKYCSCGKPSALLLEHCSYCGEALGDQHIAPIKRDPLLAAVLGESSDFQELYRSFQLLVLKNSYPVGEKHVLVLPKSTFYDIRQLRKRDVTLLEKMYQKGLESLQVEANTPVACGFSYPSDYNHLHLHLVVPPFTSLKLFQRHVFYPLPEVQVQLQRKGLVRPHPVLDLEAEEAQGQWISKMDAWGPSHWASLRGHVGWWIQGELDWDVSLGRWHVEPEFDKGCPAGCSKISWRFLLDSKKICESWVHYHQRPGGKNTWFRPPLSEHHGRGEQEKVRQERLENWSLTTYQIIW